MYIIYSAVRLFKISKMSTIINKSVTIKAIIK